MTWVYGGSRASSGAGRPRTAGSGSVRASLSRRTRLWLAALGHHPAAVGAHRGGGELDRSRLANGDLLHGVLLSVAEGGTGCGRSQPAVPPPVGAERPP